MTAKLLTIQAKDRERIENLMKLCNIKKQIDVVRAGLDLLEQEAKRKQKVSQWKQAAKAVSKSSRSINSEFQRGSRLKKIC